MAAQLSMQAVGILSVWLETLLYGANLANLAMADMGY